MRTCPEHREVVLEPTSAGMLCFLCQAIVQPIEVEDPPHKVVGFRPRLRAEAWSERPKREGTYDEPIDDGRYDRTIEAIREALRSEPGNRELRIELAELLLKSGRAEEAAATFLEIADGYVSDGVNLKAVAIYRHVLKLDDQRVDARLRLARTYERLGLRAEAEKELERLWGQLRHEGQLTSAYQVLESLLGLNPDFLPRHPEERETWEAQRRVLRAIPRMDAELAGPRSTAQFDRCLHELERILACGDLDPAHIGPWVELVMERKNPDEVISGLQRALELEPNDAALKMMLALALEAVDRP